MIINKPNEKFFSPLSYEAGVNCFLQSIKDMHRKSDKGYNDNGQVLKTEKTFTLSAMFSPFSKEKMNLPDFLQNYKFTIHLRVKKNRLSLTGEVIKMIR
ncbi:hypothetical protein [Bartonella sp. MM73XJBT.G]|uniref:hypothetical protein n=1 Tax=Bartonella sp. MM73XJBT.G TaxID=3019097 RepID=UPI0023630891|nr:hypothetical protein [Bartonella sp. MM73XJBT.G]